MSCKTRWIRVVAPLQNKDTCVWTVLFLLGNVVCLGTFLQWAYGLVNLIVDNPPYWWHEIWRIGPWTVTVASTPLRRAVVYGLLYSLVMVAMVVWIPEIDKTIVEALVSRIQGGEPVTANHGRTVAEVIYNLRHEQYEYCAVFDDCGQKVDETTVMLSHRTRVSMDTARLMRQYPGKYVHIHNHPNSFEPFSPQDLRSSLYLRRRKAIVISGKMIYTLEFTDEHWGLDETAVKAELDELLDEWSDDSGNAYWEHGVNCCRELAEKYGFVFTAEEYEESQYYKDYLAQRAQRGVKQLLRWIWGGRCVRPSV